MSGSRVVGTVAAVAVPLAWSNGVLPGLGLGIRGRTAVNAGFATGYALVAGGRPNWRAARGVRCGLLCAAVVLTGYAAALAIPSARAVLREFAARGPAVPATEWIAVHITLGTVYSEEMIFRATLDPLLDKAFGARLGALLGTAVFGLWHIAPARAAGDSVSGTVAATAAGGFVLGALRRRTDSTSAPVLLHLAVNAGGAATARLAQWFQTRAGTEPRRGHPK